jgi:hypothetical protein
MAEVLTLLDEQDDKAFTEWMKMKGKVWNGTGWERIK